MAKIGRVTDDHMSEVRINKKTFLKMSDWTPYFELLPWQHQLRHEIENNLKTCTNTKCKTSTNFNSNALAV